LYEPPPSVGALAAFGMVPEDVSGEITDIWPENYLAFQIFEAMGTQWRVGPGGAVGLDYNALPVVMRLRKITPSQRAEIFDDLRIMEDEALIVMHEDS
jgi:hypothetical protein